MLMKKSPVRPWMLLLLSIVCGVWLLKGILVPFVFGMVIAYFLNPVVENLARHKIPRWLSTTVSLTGFCLLIGLLLYFIVPLLETQIAALIKAAPGYVEKLRMDYVPGVKEWLSQFEESDINKIRDAANQSVGNAADFISIAFKKILATGFALLDILALLIITPVVASYMLLDSPQITKAIDSLFPQAYYDVIHARLKEIDSTLSGFIRGQALVCLCLGLFYCVGLTLVGLKYGAVIGITAGILTFIPYIGTGFGWISSVFLAIAQYDDDWTHIGLVIGVFTFGHILENYVLTPRFVGHRVNLHPVWIMFALLAGAHLMGFMGVLLAVPVAAVLGVLIRFAVRQYHASPMYKDVL